MDIGKSLCLAINTYAKVYDHPVEPAKPFRVKLWPAIGVEEGK
jgi:hypothetical protein